MAEKSLASTFVEICAAAIIGVATQGGADRLSVTNGNREQVTPAFVRSLNRIFIFFLQKLRYAKTFYHYCILLFAWPQWMKMQDTVVVT